MKKIIILTFLGILVVISSCDKTLEEYNVNPNDPLDVSADQLLMGTQLANISINASHLMRISGMWAGQFEGTTLLYLSLHQYNMSSEETNATWGYIYQGVVKQARVIHEKLADSDTDKDRVQKGIASIMEAYAVGTAAELFGDVPYREISDDAIPNPAFDPQAQVFADLQILLDDVIVDLSAVATNPTISGDIFYGSSRAKWIEAAYTLKARYYMSVKNYTDAYAAALNGISDPANSMVFRPPTNTADVVQNGNAHLLWTFIRERGGYMKSTGTHMATMLAAAGSRANAKTNEQARSKYYAFSGTGNPSTGIAARTSPMPLLSYEENTLILAEAGARTIDLATGLGHLNDVRAHLRSGNAFIKVAGADVLQYDDYVVSDFDATTGMENLDGIDPTRALIREIVEERYLSCLGTFVPFNDARRLRKSDGDVDVDFPLNFGSTYPERMLIAQDELNSNSNAPSPNPGVFDVTPVNQ